MNVFFVGALCLHVNERYNGKNSRVGDVGFDWMKRTDSFGN